MTSNDLFSQLAPQLIRQEAPKVSPVTRSRDLAAFTLLADSLHPIRSQNFSEELSEEEEDARMVATQDAQQDAAARQDALYVELASHIRPGASDPRKHSTGSEPQDETLSFVESCAAELAAAGRLLDAAINYAYHVDELSLSHIAKTSGKPRSTVAAIVKKHTHLPIILRARQLVQDAGLPTDEVPVGHTVERSAHSQPKVDEKQVAPDDHQESSVTKEGLPSNTGKRWTTAEHELLVKSVRQGLPDADIAAKLHRKVGGVRSRYRHLIPNGAEWEASGEEARRELERLLKTYPHYDWRAVVASFGTKPAVDSGTA